MNVEDIHEIVGSFLASAGIPHARSPDGSWVAQLHGERKLTIPVTLSVRGDVLSIESFFMRRPLENAERFYEMLLRRNARAYGLSFALDGIGDVYLVARVPAQGISDAELDRLIGALLVEADGMFDAAIEIGFATYLEADRRWRAGASG